VQLNDFLVKYEVVSICANCGRYMNEYICFDEECLEVNQWNCDEYCVRIDVYRF